MTGRPDPDPRPRGEDDTTTFMWPRSLDPTRQRVFEHLRSAGWRYDSFHDVFYEPISETVKERFGRIEWGPNWPHACQIQPPSEVVDGVPFRPAPLLILQLSEPTVPRYELGVCRDCGQPVMRRVDTDTAGQTGWGIALKGGAVYGATNCDARRGEPGDQAIPHLNVTVRTPAVVS